MKIIKIALFTICALSAYAPDVLGGTLLDLVKEDKIEEVQKYLEEQGNGEVNQANKDGETPLWRACWNNNLEIVKLLLENGAKESVNKADNGGYTPFYWACYKDNLEIVKLLLENGAKESVNKADNGGYTPFYWACWNNNLEMMKLLLKNGAKDSVNKADNFGWTPLYNACQTNNLEIVKLLLDNGADATTGVSGKKAIERICSSKWTTENRKKLLMSLLSIPEKGDENETEEQKNSRIFKELVVSSLAENMQQSSTIAPTISSNDGLHKSELVSNPEQVINQIETVVKFYLFTPFVRAPQKQDYLWPVVIGDKGSVGLEKSLFSLSLQRLKIGFGITHEHLMFLRNLQKSASRVVVICGKRKRDGKIVIPAKMMRKLCDLWFKFEYNNQ